jgi:hypothetical protein
MELPERVILDDETIYVYRSWGVAFGYQGTTRNRVHTLGKPAHLHTIHDDECIYTGCPCVAAGEYDEWWGI